MVDIDLVCADEVIIKVDEYDKESFFFFFDLCIMYYNFLSLTN